MFIRFTIVLEIVVRAVFYRLVVGSQRAKVNGIARCFLINGYII